MSNKSKSPGRLYKIRGARTARKIKVYFPKNGTRSKTKPGVRWVKSTIPSLEESK